MSEHAKLTGSKAKHEDFLRFGEGRCYVVEYEDEHVAFCYARKRAEQIVRACNSHEDLLEVSKALISFCESKERLNGDDICPTEAYDLAKAAIEKAEPLWLADRCD